MVDWERFYANFRAPGFIPGYEIQNHLGGGAFGEVYKARKTSIGKLYAVKFLRLDDEAQRDAVDRELDQVRLFASIDHPNLVTIEDMGVADGIPYLIMGYAGEDTLARRQKDGALDRAQALKIFVQTCRGVLALHDRRLAHFDLKPSNIFLNGDVARVGDYGLAKLLTEGRQTLSFGRGTPHYMAPEMLRNRADHRADIYSLGVILFESLTGSLPFEVKSDGGSVWVREVDDPPPFPQDFPADLQPVLTRCLRLDPEDRYDSVLEILGELGQGARQGDSVRLRLGAPRPLGEGEPSVPEKPAVPTDDPDSSDLREVAKVLALGLVGVARGAWEGISGRTLKRGDGPSPQPADAEPLGDDVVSVSTLGEDPPLPPASEPRKSTATEERQTPAWREELRRLREEREAEEAEAAGGELLAVRSRAPRPTAVAATVPVPPQAEGGLVGSVTQSVVVGAEIMGALATGPVTVALRGTTRVFDTVVRGVPGMLGSGLRLLMMVLLMALLGGVTALIVLFALSVQP